MLPPSLARISTKRRTPWVALLLTGSIVLLVATALPTRQVASCASIMFLFLFFLVNLCVIRIRYNMGDELHYGFLMPLFPAFPIVAILCQMVLVAFMHEMSVVAVVVAPVWVVAGAVIYRYYSRSRAAATADEVQVLEEDTAAGAGDEYNVMVPVANPDNALPLVRATYGICRAKKARVELLHMVPVPDQVPLADAGYYMLEGKEAIVETMLYLAPMFPISTTIRYCRNVARGIVSAVRAKGTDLLIMGWHGKRRSRRFALGSTVDPVIERVPCSVVVLKNFRDERFKRILVPVAGGPNSAFALEIAGILADEAEGEIVAFTVGSGRRGFDVDAFVEANMARIALPAERVRSKYVAASQPIPAILREAEDETQDYNLVVIGCTRESITAQFVRRSVPEMIAQMSSKPVAMVKASGGLRSWVRRWM
jgi:nucleotide-binding universal stress UspA family protein